MTTPKPAIERPLSPFAIYKPQISSVPSFLHRATGVGMAAGTVWLAWWLIAAASGPDAFATVQAFSASLIGRLLLLGFTWALSFHFLNGIRHLYWDTGNGFEVKSMTFTGWLVIYGSVALTLVIQVLGAMTRGGV